MRPGDRSVDVYISKLRTKLEAAMPDRRFIHTHPGFGYRFQPQPSRDVHTQAVGASHTDAGHARRRRASAPARPVLTTPPEEQ
jgi:DNA-binding winged helix-turn-helix (wHTH) protein